MTTNPSIQKIFDQAFHPSLPQYSDSISRLWGRGITDRNLVEENLRDAAFDLITLGVNSRLQDERQEDESEERYAIRLYLSGNRLTALPESIGQLRGLKYFSVPKSLRQEMESMHGQV